MGGTAGLGWKMEPSGAQTTMVFKIMLSKVESVFHWPQEGIKNEILLDIMPEGSLALSVQREF